MPICVTSFFLRAVEVSLARLVDVVRQRLLAVDMVAELHRGHAHGRVHVVGRGDVDRVQPFLFVEHLAPVLVNFGVWETLLHLTGPCSSTSATATRLKLGCLLSSVDPTMPCRSPETGMVQFAVR